MRSPTTFSELQAEVFGFYRREAFGEALELLTQHAAHFPLHANTTTFWKACLAARTGQDAMARWFLEEGIAAGEWWAPAILESDEDLAPLRGDPEFARIVGLCAERAADAERESLPLLLTAEPAGPPPWPAVLALHGASWNGVSFARHWRAARDAGWLLAAPQSSQPSGPDRYGWMDHERAVREIATHLDALRAGGRADPARIVAGGFSAGAKLALRIAADHGLSGVIAVAAPLAPGDTFTTEWAPRLAGAGVRATLVAGTRDLHGRDGADELAAAIVARGGRAEVVVRDVAHEFPPDFHALLPDLLAATIA